MLHTLAQQVRDDIAQLPGVTQATVSNTRPYEISIEVSEQSLRRNGLTFDEVAAAVRSGSLDLPGGSIKTSAGEILLRTKGQAYWGREFEDLVVTTRADGTRLYLKDVATIVDGFEERAFLPNHPQTQPLGWGGNFSEIPPVLLMRMKLKP